MLALFCKELCNSGENVLAIWKENELTSRATVESASAPGKSGFSEPISNSPANVLDARTSLVVNPDSPGEQGVVVEQTGCGGRGGGTGTSEKGTGLALDWGMFALWRSEQLLLA